MKKIIEIDLPDNNVNSAWLVRTIANELRGGVDSDGKKIDKLTVVALGNVKQPEAAAV